MKKTIRIFCEIVLFVLVLGCTIYGWYLLYTEKSRIGGLLASITGGYLGVSSLISEIADYKKSKAEDDLSGAERSKFHLSKSVMIIIYALATLLYTWLRWEALK